MNNPNAETWEECVQLRRSLRNCLLLAMREMHRTANREPWEHILRFCKEAGVEPSPLRSTLNTGANDGIAPAQS